MDIYKEYRVEKLLPPLPSAPPLSLSLGDPVNNLKSMMVRAYEETLSSINYVGGGEKDSRKTIIMCFRQNSQFNRTTWLTPFCGQFKSIPSVTLLCIIVVYTSRLGRIIIISDNIYVRSFSR